ncbi:hypothetical protein AB0O87_07350 [Microbacterium sp. NPDC076768]
MKNVSEESAQQDAPTGLQPLLKSLDLPEAEQAGYCSDGVCKLPAAKDD